MVRTSSITVPSMVEIVGRAPTADEKCDVLCLFVILWNYEVCNNGNAMKQCHFQNNYGVIACRKVCSCASICNFSCGPPEFSLRGKFIPKPTIFRDFGGCKPIFFTATTVKFGMRVQTWDTLPRA